MISEDQRRRKLASVGVEIYKPKNHSPKGLVEEAKQKIKVAKQEKNPLDFIWLVFDKDGHQNIANTFSSAEASRPKINIAFTAICFEYYILLHFEKTTKPFSKCKDVIGYIKAKKYISDYEKASNLIGILGDKLHVGIENSKWCCQRNQHDLTLGKLPHELASYSDVHKLVEFLFQLSS